MISAANIDPGNKMYEYTNVARIFAHISVMCVCVCTYVVLLFRRCARFKRRF